MDASLVTAGKPRVAGAVFRAPLGSTLPTDASTALDAAFVNLGYISEDGLTNGNAPDSDVVRAWGGDPVLYTSNGKEDTWQFSMISAKDPNVLKAVYNDANVSGDITTGITVKATTEDSEFASWVFDMVLKDGTLKRVVVPSGKITDMDDITYNDSDPVGYNVTVSATADDDSVTHYEYMINPTATTTTTTSLMEA